MTTRKQNGNYRLFLEEIKFCIGSMLLPFFFYLRSEDHSAGTFITLCDKHFNISVCDCYKPWTQFTFTESTSWDQTLANIALHRATTIFPLSHYHRICIFASDEQEPECRVPKWVTLKVMSPILCWPSITEFDVSGMAVETKHSRSNWCFTIEC